MSRASERFLWGLALCGLVFGVILFEQGRTAAGPVKIGDTVRYQGETYRVYDVEPAGNLTIETADGRDSAVVSGGEVVKTAAGR